MNETEVNTKSYVKKKTIVRPTKVIKAAEKESSNHRYKLQGDILKVIKTVYSLARKLEDTNF